jgi:AcrR family transcriptional regulator
MKDKIMAAALKVAAKKGLNDITRLDIATAAGVAVGSVSYHFGDMRKIRAAIVREALENRDLVVIGRALGANHPLAVKAAPELKKAAAQALSRI